MLEQKSYKLLYAAPKSSDFWITIYMTLCLKPNNTLAVEPGAKFWKDIFKKIDLFIMKFHHICVLSWAAKKK